MLVKIMDAKFFANNRQQLVAQVDKSTPIVVGANGLLQRNDDTTFPFRQDSNFFYLTGVNQPDIILVIDKDGEYLIVPGRNQQRQHFDGAINLDELSKISGVEQVLDELAGWSRLKSQLKNKVALPKPMPSYDKNHGFYPNPANARLLRKLKRHNSGLKIVDLQATLTQMRAVKQPAELEAIQKAIDITILGINNTVNKLTSYKHEYEIEADLTKTFRASGASGHAFNPIVASGANACTLHNVTNNSQLSANDLLTLDVGSEVNNYAADITRTISLNPQPGQRQQQIHAAVLEAQNYALSLLKVGTNLLDYEAKVAKYIGQKLVDLKLIKSANDVHGIRQYFPHATSHFLGLDTHDVGNYHEPLKANMVLTCEPGIYIPEEGIGVRIEDDVLITASGNQVLSRKLPRALAP